MPAKTLERLAQSYEHKARVLREAIRLLREDASWTDRHFGQIDALVAAIDAERLAPPPGYGARSRERARRRASADLLAHFDPVTPRDAPPGRERAVAPLIRWGFLKKKNDGYIRTAKEFRITDTG